MKVWNKAIMLRHLWAIGKKADTVWVKWIHTFNVRNHNFWFMNPPCRFLMESKEADEVGRLYCKNVIANGIIPGFGWIIGPLMGLLCKTLGVISLGTVSKCKS